MPSSSKAPPHASQAWNLPNATGKACDNQERPQPSSLGALQQKLHALPPTAQELIRVLGSVEALIDLVAALGGVTVRVPCKSMRSKERKNPLYARLSPKHMQTLINYYGGTEIYIPRCVSALRRVRNAVIVEKFSTRAAAGQSSITAVRDLALEYQLTDRRIWQILKSTPDVEHFQSENARVHARA